IPLCCWSAPRISRHLLLATSSNSTISDLAENSSFFRNLLGRGQISIEHVEQHLHAPSFCFFHIVKYLPLSTEDLPDESLKADLYVPHVYPRSPDRATPALSACQTTLPAAKSSAIAFA